MVKDGESAAAYQQVQRLLGYLTSVLWKNLSEYIWYCYFEHTQKYEADKYSLNKKLFI